MPNDYYGDLCVGDALKEIDNAPTISAVPVVRGGVGRSEVWRDERVAAGTGDV